MKLTLFQIHLIPSLPHSAALVFACCTQLSYTFVLAKHASLQWSWSWAWSLSMRDYVWQKYWASRTNEYVANWYPKSQITVSGACSKWVYIAEKMLFRLSVTGIELEARQTEWVYHIKRCLQRAHSSNMSYSACRIRYPLTPLKPHPPSLLMRTGPGMWTVSLV